MIPKVKYLYQYGNALGAEKNLVLPKGFGDDKYSATASTGVKTVYAGTNNLGDGEADLIPNRTAFKEVYNYEVTFPIGELEKGDNPSVPVYDLDVVNGVMFDKPKFLFAYSTDTSGNIDRILYTPKTRAKSTPSQYETEWNNLSKSDFYYTVNLQPLRPYWYDCTAFVNYYSYTDYIASINYWDNPAFVFDTGDLYDAGGASSSFSSLSQANKNLYFSTWNNNYLLSIIDRFFDNDISGTGTNYLINQAIVPGVTDITTANVLSTSNTRNDVYLIDFEPLAQNESLTFQNTDNDSGLKITWLGNSANANNMRFNSYLGKLYDKVTGLEITQANYQLELPSSNSELLYFTGLYNPRSLLPTTTENLRVTSTASGNISTQIDVLITIN